MVKRKATHYETLGVETHVSSQEIKKAYRALVKDLHPDVDYKSRTTRERSKATERMVDLNEAYETLMDRTKRADYDDRIGVGRRSGTRTKLPSIDEEAAREKYLAAVFHPARRPIVNCLNQYKTKLAHLSQDIYDDELLEQFVEYVEEMEAILVKSSNAIAKNPAPSTLAPAVQWMRHGIAQASDGLDELKRFCGNYDYDHLSMAGNLFRIALDHFKKAGHAAKDQVLHH